MASLARSTAASLVPRAQRTAVKPVTSKVTSPRLPMQRTAAPSITSSSSSLIARSSPMEIAQIAGEASFITGTALTMCAMTLVGLAFGFILLRVEALVEEGKL